MNENLKKVIVGGAILGLSSISTIAGADEVTKPSETSSAPASSVNGGGTASVEKSNLGVDKSNETKDVSGSVTTGNTDGTSQANDMAGSGISGQGGSNAGVSADTTVSGADVSSPQKTDGAEVTEVGKTSLTGGVVEAPRGDNTSNEAPKTEVTKEETPKNDVHKTEAPKTDGTRTELAGVSKEESPKTDGKIEDTTKPTEEKPKETKPSSDEKPKDEKPKTEKPTESKDLAFNIGGSVTKVLEGHTNLVKVGSKSITTDITGVDTSKYKSVSVVQKLVTGEEVVSPIENVTIKPLPSKVSLVTVDSMGNTTTKYLFDVDTSQQYGVSVDYNKDTRKLEFKLKEGTRLYENDSISGQLKATDNKSDFMRYNFDGSKLVVDASMLYNGEHRVVATGLSRYGIKLYGEAIFNVEGSNSKPLSRWEDNPNPLPRWEDNKDKDKDTDKGKEDKDKEDKVTPTPAPTPEPTPMPAPAPTPSPSVDEFKPAPKPSEDVAPAPAPAPKPMPVPEVPKVINPNNDNPAVGERVIPSTNNVLPTPAPSPLPEGGKQEIPKAPANEERPVVTPEAPKGIKDIQIAGNSIYKQQTDSERGIATNGETTTFTNKNSVDISVKVDTKVADSSRTEVILKGRRQGMIDSGKFIENKNGTYKIKDLAEDDYYTLTVKTYDNSGKLVNDVSENFSLNKKGSRFSLEGIQGKAFKSLSENVVVTETNVDQIKVEKTVIKVYRDGKLIEIDKNSVHNKRTGGIKGDWKYLYSIAKEQFSKDGVYTIEVSSESETGIKYQSSKTMQFTIDNTAPEISIYGIKEGGRYKRSKVRITFDIKDLSGVSSIRAWVNGKEVEVKYDKESQTYYYEFTSEGKDANSLKVMVEDAAGNTSTTEIGSFYVSEDLAFSIFNDDNFKYIIGGAITGIVGLLTFGLYRRNKRLKEEDKLALEQARLLVESSSSGAVSGSTTTTGSFGSLALDNEEASIDVAEALSSGVSITPVVGDSLASILEEATASNLVEEPTVEGEAPTEIQEDVTEAPTDVVEAATEAPTEIQEEATDVVEGGEAPTEIQEEATEEQPTEIQEETPTEIQEEATDIQGLVEEPTEEAPTDLVEEPTDVQEEPTDVQSIVEEHTDVVGIIEEPTDIQQEEPTSLIEEPTQESPTEVIEDVTEIPTEEVSEATEVQNENEEGTEEVTD